MTRRLALALMLAGLGVSVGFADEPLVVTPVLTTAPLYNYEDAPATPDGDDPAIWVNRDDPQRSLVIATAKDAGLLVYDLAGTLVQAILPPNAPHISPDDPPTPGGGNPAPDHPCIDSVSRESFGRYNNVDIAYNLRLGSNARAARADVAVVSDRGCDRVRFFRIDPTRANAPLVDITASDVPRVFPDRFDQPSPFQPSGGAPGWQDNPVDDQNTVYGLIVAQGGSDDVFVSERERGLVRQLRILPASNGTLTYSLKRTFLFDTSFDLVDENRNPYVWTPCREAVEEEPQSEGLMYDATNDTLYVAFETIGLYRIPLSASMPALVRVNGNRLVEPVRSFGRGFVATPDDDEFECDYGGVAEPGDIAVHGSDVHAGGFLEADLEGLTIISSVPGSTLLLASSQGDSSFHFYLVHGQRPHHLGSFLIEGVGDTDGVHYVPAALNRHYPLGLLVVQNGQAPEPADTGDINGFEFDGATQFLYVNFVEALRALR